MFTLLAAATILCAGPPTIELNVAPPAPTTCTAETCQPPTTTTLQMYDPPRRRPLLRAAAAPIRVLRIVLPPYRHRR